MSVEEITKEEAAGAASASRGGEETARTRRRSAREHAILDAAQQIMAETGYDAMTMDELAARAHVSKPTLYQYFPSKEAVAVQAIIGLMQQSHNYLNGMDDQMPAVLRLENFVRWVLEERFSPFRAAFGASKTALAPVVRAHPDYQVKFAQLVSAVAFLVERAKNENDLSRELSTRIVVQMVFSLLRDSEYDLLIASGECLRGEVVQTLSALFLCGIRYCPDSKKPSSPSDKNQFDKNQRGAAFPSFLSPTLEPTG